MSFRHIFAIHTDRRMSPAQHQRINTLLLKEGIKLTDLAPFTASNINQHVFITVVDGGKGRHINHLDKET